MLLIFIKLNKFFWKFITFYPETVVVSVSSESPGGGDVVDANLFLSFSVGQS